MGWSATRYSRLLACALPVLTVLGPDVASGQPVLDLVLSDAQLAAQIEQFMLDAGEIVARRFGKIVREQ